jgi:hypothetical protein
LRGRWTFDGGRDCSDRAIDCFWTVRGGEAKSDARDARTVAPQQWPNAEAKEAVVNDERISRGWEDERLDWETCVAAHLDAGLAESAAESPDGLGQAQAKLITMGLIEIERSLRRPKGRA